MFRFPDGLEVALRPPAAGRGSRAGPGWSFGEKAAVYDGTAIPLPPVKLALLRKLAARATGW